MWKCCLNKIIYGMSYGVDRMQGLCRNKNFEKWLVFEWKGDVGVPNDGLQSLQRMDRRNFILYNPKPVPDSHIGSRKRCVGVRSALRQRLEERTYMYVTGVCTYSTGVTLTCSTSVCMWNNKQINKRNIWKKFRNTRKLCMYCTVRTIKVYVCMYVQDFSNK
jgi:hypothetical protein